MAFQYIPAYATRQPSIYPESAAQPPQQGRSPMQGLGLAKQFMGGTTAAPTGMAAGGGPAGMADVSGLAAAEAGMGGSGMGAFGGTSGATAFAPAMSAPGAAGGGGAGASAGSGMAAAGPWAALFAGIMMNEYNAMKTGDRPEDTGELLKEYGTAGVLKSDIEGRFSKYFGGEGSGGTAFASALASPAYADPRDQLGAQKDLFKKGAKFLGKVF